MSCQQTPIAHVVRYHALLLISNHRSSIRPSYSASPRNSSSFGPQSPIWRDSSCSLWLCVSLAFIVWLLTLSFARRLAVIIIIVNIVVNAYCCPIRVHVAVNSNNYICLYSMCCTQISTHTHTHTRSHTYYACYVMRDFRSHSCSPKWNRKHEHEYKEDEEQKKHANWSG